MFIWVNDRKKCLFMTDWLGFLDIKCKSFTSINVVRDVRLKTQHRHCKLWRHVPLNWQILQLSIRQIQISKVAMFIIKLILIFHQNLSNKQCINQWSSYFSVQQGKCCWGIFLYFAKIGRYYKHSLSNNINTTNISQDTTQGRTP